MNLHPFGKDVFIQIIHCRIYFFQHARRVLIPQQLHHPLNAILVVYLIIQITHNPLALEIPIFQFTQILHIDRLPCHGLHHHISQVLEVTHKAHTAHHVAQITADNRTTTRIGVIAFNRLRNFTKR